MLPHVGQFGINITDAPRRKYAVTLKKRERERGERERKETLSGTLNQRINEL